MIEAGTLLGPYEVLAELGAGGMGEVYRAKDTRLGREVALKVLPEHLATDPNVLQRFEREAKALAALSHPSILSVFDVGVQDGVSFVVMELLEGETLQTRLQNGPLPWQKALEIATAVAEGLAAAHSKGIIHRDLKPDNIFLTTSSIVKILDFGLARFDEILPDGNVSRLQTVEQKTSPGTLIGTVRYMSPEQLRGMPVDARSDIFSFGCVLYEMLTGIRPFSSASAVETIASILKDAPPEVSGSAKNIPAQLDRIVRICLEKNPENRFVSTQDLVLVLKEIAISGVQELMAAKGRKPRKSRRQIDSLAILPFANMSADPDAEYLSDGITESIINTLSQLPKLKIMARSTVFRYKGQDVDPQIVGKDLNVRAVLSGRLTPRGDLLNVQAELVDTSDGSRLWGEQYSRELCDILQAQEDISRQISDGLRLKLVSNQRKRLTKRPTENSEAYRLYLKGRYYWNKRTEESLRMSIDYFEQSIQQDAQFALAYAGLSDAYGLLGGFGYIPAKEAYSRAKTEAVKALELDDTLAEAHTALATVLYRYDWNWAEAEREFLKSIDLNPGYATAHHWYGVLLGLLGRIPEALKEVRKAIDLDPLSLVTHWTLGFIYYYARDYDQAIEQYQKTLEMDPTYGRVRIDIGLVYCLKGMYPEAIMEIQKGISLLEESPMFVAALAYVYGKAGEKQEAIKIVEELKEQSKRKYVSRYLISTVYVGLGDLDEAFQWLEKAYEEREDAMVSLNVNPRLDPLQGDPRFHDLLRRIGLK